MDRQSRIPPPMPGDFPQGPRQPTLMERRMASTDGSQQQASAAGAKADDPFIQAIMKANGIAPANASATDSSEQGTAQFLRNPDALLVRGTYIRCVLAMRIVTDIPRSEEHTSELQSLMRISYAVFCLKKKK